MRNVELGVVIQFANDHTGMLIPVERLRIQLSGAARVWVKEGYYLASSGDRSKRMRLDIKSEGYQDTEVELKEKDCFENSGMLTIRLIPEAARRREVCISGKIGPYEELLAVDDRRIIKLVSDFIPECDEGLKLLYEPEEVMEGKLLWLEDRAGSCREILCVNRCSRLPNGNAPVISIQGHEPLLGPVLQYEVRIRHVFRTKAGREGLFSIDLPDMEQFRLFRKKENGGDAAWRCAYAEALPLHAVSVWRRVT